MTVPFTPIGPSGTIVAGGTAQAVELVPGEYGQPNVLYVCCNDPTYSIAVNAVFGDEAVDAVLPDSDFNGVGAIVGPQGPVMIKLDSAYQTQSLWISVVADGTSRVFITPGIL